MKSSRSKLKKSQNESKIVTINYLKDYVHEFLPIGVVLSYSEIGNKELVFEIYDIKEKKKLKIRESNIIAVEITNEQYDTSYI